MRQRIGKTRLSCRRSRFGFAEDARVWWLAATLAASSCVTPLSRLTREQESTTPQATYLLHLTPSEPAAEVERISRLLGQVTLPFSRWGPAEHRIEVFVLPSHADLETVVRRRGYGWLKAWAQFDRILLQTPSSWGATDADLLELFSHELTHCVMYQRIASSLDWKKKDVPLWFREGMASWTAQQAYRWMTLEDLARVFETSDPITNAEKQVRDASSEVYAAAHHAFAFLVQRYGVERIQKLLNHMQSGAKFEEAFHRANGVPPAQFLAEFRRYVLWRGYRGYGRPLRATSVGTPQSTTSQPRF